jgi:hypothetical protein
MLDNLHGKKHEIQIGVKVALYYCAYIVLEQIDRGGPRELNVKFDYVVRGGGTETIRCSCSLM